MLDKTSEENLIKEIARLQKENEYYASRLREEQKKVVLLKQKIKAYFNHSDLAYLILDKEQNIIDVNDIFCSLFGYTKEEIISLPFSYIFTTPQLYHTWRKNYLNFSSFESVSNLEYRLQKKNKYIFWAELFGNRFEDNEEEFSVWSIRDISMRVRSRNTIRNLNTNLQLRIDEEVERNLMIQRSHQEEMIRNAKFASIGQMAAGITHEINTPLTYIKGNIEMLLEDIAKLDYNPIKENMLKDGMVIQDGLARIENIIQTMREASQKSTEEHEVVNLYATLISALILSYNRSKQVVKIILNGTSFDMGMAKETFIYRCKLQKQRIEQVWIIILNNALDELIKIEHFDERSLHVEIGTMNKQVFVRFCDNAGGISEDILPRIFEPFESTKVSKGSMGIGLNIAQQIVLQNDGQIEAYNHEKGAVFEVSFPLFEKE